jgi:hypothetical protein
MNQYEPDAALKLDKMTVRPIFTGRLLTYLIVGTIGLVYVGRVLAAMQLKARATSVQTSNS